MCTRSQPDVDRRHRPVSGNSALFGEEAPEPVEEDDEQHDRLLARHRHAGDLLVGERAEPPDARRAGRRSGTRASAASASRRPSGAARTNAAKAYAARAPDASRRGTILDERPPEEEAGPEVAGVLDVDQPRRVAQRGVVDRPAHARRSSCRPRAAARPPGASRTATARPARERSPSLARHRAPRAAAPIRRESRSEAGAR